MRISTTPEQESALRSARDTLAMALAELDEADGEHWKVIAEINNARAKFSIALSSVDLANAAAIDDLASERGRIEVLAEWVAAAPRVRRAIGGVQSALSATREPLTQCCQERHIEEGALLLSLSRGDGSLLDVNHTVADHVIAMRRNATQRLREADLVLSRRCGLLLSQDEKRTGLLEYGIGRGRRQLTVQERLQGYILE